MTKNKYILALLMLAALMCGSCSKHFGSVDDVRPNYGDKERQMSFTFEVEPMHDGNHYRALEVAGNDLALFGTDFIGRRDTAKVVGKDDQVVMMVTQHKAPAKKLSIMGNDWQTYTCSAKAKIKNGTEKAYGIVHPYLPMSGLAADTANVRLDFSVQDGTLQGIAENCNFCWGKADATCGQDPKGVVGGDETVRMQRKYALLRLDLVSDDGTLTLSKRLKQHGMAYGTGYGISSIKISGNGDTDGISEYAYLNPQSGMMRYAQQGMKAIVLRDASGRNMADFKTHDIMPGDEESLDGRAWGTSCFVAFPLTGEQEADNVTIFVTVTANVAGNVEQYYGRIVNRQLFENGKIYVTSPIRCFTSEEEMTEADEAEVYEI